MGAILLSIKSLKVMYHKMSVDEYLNDLREKPETELCICQLTDYINAIEAIRKIYKTGFFRGQAQKSWNIESSAYRNPTTRTYIELRTYHEHLLTSAKTMNGTDEYNEMSLLAHLQHNGAKTCLIDYSRNPLVALWFACVSQNEKDRNKNAAVYYIKGTSRFIRVDENFTLYELFENPSTNTIYIFEPPQINRRITSQQSVFLINPEGKIKKEQHITIQIPWKCKSKIQKELEIFGVSKRTVFPDFQGFTEWFSTDKAVKVERFQELIEKANNELNNKKTQISLETFKDALKLQKELLKEEKNSAELGAVYSGFSNAYFALEKYEEALNSSKEVLSINTKLFGKNHPEIANIYIQIANIFLKLDFKDDQQRKENIAKSLEYNQKALKIYKKCYGDENIKVALAYNNIAEIYTYNIYIRDRFLRAKEFYISALGILEKPTEIEYLELAKTYNGIAGTYSVLKEYEEAIVWTMKALPIKEKELGVGHPETIRLYMNIAEYYRALSFDENLSLGDQLDKNLKSRDWYKKAQQACKEDNPQNEVYITEIVAAIEEIDEDLKYLW